MKNQAQFAANEPGSAAPAMIIRVHLENGSIQSFIQKDETTARKTWDMIDPVKVFTMPRLVIAGDYSKSVFVAPSIARIDFVQHFCPCWQFPDGYSDIVELSEEDFRKNAHLEEPELMPKREQCTSVGDLLVSFLKLEFRSATPLYLMTEVSTKLPADSLSFMRFLLSKTGLHMRLRGGGIGVINLAQLSCYTAYPGVPQVPTDTWPAEPVSGEAIPVFERQDVNA
jgi:hypothetical protein